MNKKKHLELIIRLAGFEVQMCDYDSLNGWEIHYVDKHKIGYFIEGMDYQTALGNLLAMLYDTEDIDFEGNAAILSNQ